MHGTLAGGGEGQTDLMSSVTDIPKFMDSAGETLIVERELAAEMKGLRLKRMFVYRI